MFLYVITSKPGKKYWSFAYEQNHATVQHDYSVHDYHELALIEKSVSSPLILSEDWYIDGF